MTGSIVLIRQKTTDLKRRFTERAAERRMKKTALLDEAELRSQEKHTISRNPSYDDSTLSTKSSMVSLAIASSTFASNCSSEVESYKATQFSALYQPSSGQEKTQIVHPVIYKRDIYLASRKEPAPAKAVQKLVDNRGIMNDVSNLSDEGKTSLPSFSLTGSMLCRELEKGRIRPNGTKAPKSMTSPQKPMGLPPNTIVASMLFRTLQEEAKSKNITYDNDHRLGVASIPQEVVSSPKDDNESTVSSITLHTKESEVDPAMVKASKNLLRILQANHFEAFDARPRTTLYEA